MQSSEDRSLFFKFTVESESLERVVGTKVMVADYPLTAEDKGLG